MTRRERERETERETERQADRQTDRQTDRQREKTRQDYFIVRPPAHYSRSEHSGNSNSHGYASVFY